MSNTVIAYGGGERSLHWTARVNSAAIRGGGAHPDPNDEVNSSVSRWLLRVTQLQFECSISAHWISSEVIIWSDSQRYLSYVEDQRNCYLSRVQKQVTNCRKLIFLYWQIIGPSLLCPVPLNDMKDSLISFVFTCFPWKWLYFGSTSSAALLCTHSVAQHKMFAYRLSQVGSGYTIVRTRHTDLVNQQKSK